MKVAMTNAQLANELEVSITTIQEVKAKLKIEKRKALTDEDCRIITDFVNDIKAKFDKVTLSTINEYLKLKGVEEDEIKGRN